MSNEELSAVIKDAIHEALEGAKFPQCSLELQRIISIEELSKKLSIIITGNGTPENGLISKHIALSTDVNNFHVETRKEIQQLKEIEKEKRTREWALFMVGVGLVATTVWQIIVH